jgi:hypothetical protein
MKVLQMINNEAKVVDAQTGKIYRSFGYNWLTGMANETHAVLVGKDGQTKLAQISNGTMRSIGLLNAVSAVLSGNDQLTIGYNNGRSIVYNFNGTVVRTL